MKKGRRKRRTWTIACGVTLLTAVVLVGGCRSFRKSIVATVRTPKWKGAPVTVPANDEREAFEVVQRYAPVLRQLVQLDSRMNFPLDIEFDGDLDASNNHQSLYDSDHESDLIATLYYAVVETETHYFITYLVYHAWDRWEKGGKTICNHLRLGGSHENDGENVQVVVRKARGDKPEVLDIIACQHHNATDFFVQAERFGKGKRTFGSSDLEDGRPVFHLEPGKHGIYLKDMPEFADARTVTFTHDPKNEGDVWTAEGKNFTYALRPIRTTFWKWYVEGKALGDSGIMDGAFSVDLSRAKGTGPKYDAVPRFFNSDEWSVLFLKRNAGITPFFFGQGELFFDPAWHYRKRFEPKGPWSVDYSFNPYLIPPNKSSPK